MEWHHPHFHGNSAIPHDAWYNIDIHHRAGTSRLHQLGTPRIHFPHTGQESWITHQHFHASSQGGGWFGTWIGIYDPTIWRAVLGALWTAVAKSGSCDRSIWWTHVPAGRHENLGRRWQKQGVHVGWRSTGAAACWALDKKAITRSTPFWSWERTPPTPTSEASKMYSPGGRGNDRTGVQLRATFSFSNARWALAVHSNSLLLLVTSLRVLATTVKSGTKRRK